MEPTPESGIGTDALLSTSPWIERTAGAAVAASGFRSTRVVHRALPLWTSSRLCLPQVLTPIWNFGCIVPRGEATPAASANRYWIREPHLWFERQWQATWK